jgi:hypothetical protein
METYAVRRPPSVTFGDGKRSRRDGHTLLDSCALRDVVPGGLCRLESDQMVTQPHKGWSFGDDVNGGGELMTKPSVSETKPLVPQTEEGNYP